MSGCRGVGVSGPTLRSRGQASGGTLTRDCRAAAHPSRWREKHDRDHRGGGQQDPSPRPGEPALHRGAGSTLRPLWFGNFQVPGRRYTKLHGRAVPRVVPSETLLGTGPVPNATDYRCQGWNNLRTEFRLSECANRPLQLLLNEISFAPPKPRQKTAFSPYPILTQD